MVNKRKLFTFIFFLLLSAASVLCGQEHKFKQKLSWVADKNAFEYKVEIRGVDSAYKSLIEAENTFVEVSLPAGDYKYRVYAYDFLGRQASVSEWRNFTVLKAVSPKIENKTKEVVPVKEEGKVTIPVDVKSIEADSTVVLVNTETKKEVKGKLDIKTDDKKNLVASEAVFPQVEEGDWVIKVTNPSGLSTESEKIAVEPQKTKAQIAAEKKAEEDRIAAEKKAEEEKIAAAKKAEEDRIRAEKLAEEKRLEEARKAEEERLAAERKAEEERLAEEKRIAEAKKAEEERLAAEKRAEEERLLAEKLAEEKRLEELRIAEEKAEQERLLAEKLEMEKRKAEEQKAEEERIAAEKKAEKERLAAEKKAEEERLAAEKKAEKERLAAEKKAEEERLAAEKKAEEERLAAERKAEKERIAEEKEKIETEKLEAEKRIIAQKGRMPGADFTLLFGGGAAYDLGNNDLFEFNTKTLWGTENPVKELMPQAVARMQWLPVKNKAVKFGMELACSQGLMLINNDFIEAYFPITIPQANLVFQLKLFSPKIMLSAKAGASLLIVNEFITYKNTDGSREATDLTFMNIGAQAGLSLFLIPAKHFSFEMGADFIATNYLESYLLTVNPYLVMGVRF